MKFYSSPAFPSFNISLETEEEVYDFFYAIQHFLTPYNKKSMPEKYSFVEELEREARNHFIRNKK